MTTDVGPKAATATKQSFDRRIWFLALGTFALGTDSFVVSGVLNQIARDLAIDLDAAGNVVSSYSLAYGLSAPFLAALAGRFRKDRVLMIAMALFSTANGLCAIAPSYKALILARILTGLAAALYTPTAYALAASVTAPERKASALAAVAFGITMSFVAGVPLGMVVGGWLGWHASFWFVAITSLVALAAIWQFPLRGAQLVVSRLSLAARFTPLVDPRILLALLPTLLFTAGNLSTYTYFGALLYYPSIFLRCSRSLLFHIRNRRTGGHSYRRESHRSVRCRSAHHCVLCSRNTQHRHLSCIIGVPGVARNYGVHASFQLLATSHRTTTSPD